MRLADFHRSDSGGELALIGGGGEAVVFGDQARQRVIKLLGGAGRAGFGWVMDQDAEGLWVLRPGGLAEALERFALAERCFPTGLEIEAIGAGGGFLLLSQPFIVGDNPSESELAAWMQARGWERVTPPTRLDMLAALSWRRGDTILTDVRPENALLAEADGEIVPFDVIAAPFR